MKIQHTTMKDSILVEDRVAMSLMWLGNGNSLQLMGDLFGVSKGFILVIMKEFCQMVRLHLQKLFVQFSNEP